jgi:ABC-type branched-subunit amino acid transport system substrate-binding protein
MDGKHRCRVGAVTAALLVASVAALGFGGSAGAKPASGEPLKFGALNLTGPGAVPSAGQALQGYIDDWNHRGGFNGQPIEIVTEDVGFDPAASIAAVNKLIDENVVAFTSIGNCQVTKQVLRGKGVAAWGFSGNPKSQFFCFDDSFMVATITQSGTTLPMLQYAIDKAVKTFGVLGPAGFAGTFAEPLHDYLDLHPGLKVNVVEAETPAIVPTAADIDAGIAKLKDAGVKALFAVAPAESAVTMLTSARRAGFGPEDGIIWIFAPNIYDPAVVDVPEFEGTYVLTTTFPWEDTGNPQVKRMIKVTRHKIEIRDGFAVTGYQSGALLEKSLKGLKGEVTRASLLEHWQSLTNIKLPMTPMTIDFSDPSKAPAGGQILKVEHGKFVPASDYLVTPTKEFYPK